MTYPSKKVLLNDLDLKPILRSPVYRLMILSIHKIIEGVVGARLRSKAIKEI